MTLVIDGSHSRVTEFDTAIIRYAVRNYGMTLDAAGTETLEAGERDAAELVSDLGEETVEALRFLSDEAVEFLNSHVPAYVWYVEESCLWFEDAHECDSPFCCFN
jgi:hypothetical protein